MIFHIDFIIIYSVIFALKLVLHVINYIHFCDSSNKIKPIVFYKCIICNYFELVDEHEEDVILCPGHTILSFFDHLVSHTKVQPHHP